MYTKHVARTYRSGKGSFLLSIEYYCKSYVHEDSFVVLVMHGQYSTIYSCSNIRIQVEEILYGYSKLMITLPRMISVNR